MCAKIAQNHETKEWKAKNPSKVLPSHIFCVPLRPKLSHRTAGGSASGAHWKQFIAERGIEYGLQFVTPFFINSPNCLYTKKSSNFLQSYEKSRAEQKILIFFMPRRSNFAIRWQSYQKSRAKQRNSFLFLPRCSKFAILSQVHSGEHSRSALLCTTAYVKKCNYPLILHQLLNISELARNYPLIIRQLSYTICEFGSGRQDLRPFLSTG